MFGGEEVSMFSAYNSIRRHKTFLSEVRKQSELKCGYGLYDELFCAVLSQRTARGVYEGICPTMRIACDGSYKKYREDEEWLNSYKDICIQSGRIIFRRDLHGVRLFISFDITELAKYILLTDEERIDAYLMQKVMNEYSSYLLEVLKSKYPHRKFIQKFFRIESYQYDKIRARMCEILSYYMEQMSKKRLLARTQVKKIETMYGMPARDKDKPRYKQLYV